MTNPLQSELLWPIFGAVVAGLIIGAEREYRASPAGIRTHVLVSLACCLLMLSAVHQIRWLTDTPEEIIRIDPVRMAHGILTGIGFLCGGVIFRDGLNVRGLTTAASLWSTSALGILFGIGFYTLAIIGSVTVFLVLAAANLTERFFPQRRFARLAVSYDKKSAPSRSSFNSFLIEHRFTAAALAQDFDGQQIKYSVTLGGADKADIDAFLALLTSDRAVKAVEFEPHDS